MTTAEDVAAVSLVSNPKRADLQALLDHATQIMIEIGARIRHHGATYTDVQSFLQQLENAERLRVMLERDTALLSVEQAHRGATQVGCQVGPAVHHGAVASSTHPPADAADPRPRRRTRHPF